MSAATIALKSVLEETIKTIADLESSAKVALYEHNNDTVYRENILARAQTLAALSSKVAPYIEALSDCTMADTLRNTLENFSSNAKTAIKLNSIFYMSALLYPDAYEPGQPNNLEKLVATAFS